MSFIFYRTSIAAPSASLLYDVMSAYYTIVSATPTSSLMVFAPNPGEALRRYDEIADSTKRRVTTFDDAGTELTRDDLMRLADSDAGAPPSEPDLSAQDLAIRSTARP